jgi:hypothetical protein
MYNWHVWLRVCKIRDFVIIPLSPDNEDLSIIPLSVTFVTFISVGLLMVSMSSRWSVLPQGERGMYDAYLKDFIFWRVSSLPLRERCRLRQRGGNSAKRANGK